MPPRPSPRIRITPVPRPTRRGRPASNRNTNEVPIVDTNETTTIPQVQMDPSQLETLVARSIATALAAYETARNDSSGHSANLGASPAPNQTNPKYCSYKDFLNCKPQNFTGAEGVIGLSQWVEKMETVFRISSCSEDCKVKYATCTLTKSALTWWNDHATSMGQDLAYAMDWETFKEMMIAEYCPRQEIQALEQELWGLTMKESEVIAYTSRFNDLAALCPMMVNPEHRKTERYIWGLASPVQGLVTAAGPSTYDKAKQLAYRLTEQCIRRGTMNPQTKNSTGDIKRKFHERSKTDNKHSRPNSAPTAVYAAITDSESIAVDAAIINPEPTNVYAATANLSTNTPTNISAQSKAYVGKSPYCNKCNYHHYGICMFCNNCNGKGHTSNFCKRAFTPTPDTTNATPTEEGVRVCYECNLPGHYRNECPKLKNRGGPGRVYLLGTKKTHTLE